MSRLILMHMPPKLAALRAKLETDPYSDKTQAVYDVCREARLHTWNRDDPEGGGRLLVYEKYRKQISKVSRELTCTICTTMRVAVYWYRATGVMERYARDGNYAYDWPDGYREVVTEGHERLTMIDYRSAAFDRLDVVDLDELVRKS